MTTHLNRRSAASLVAVVPAAVTIGVRNRCRKQFQEDPTNLARTVAEVDGLLDPGRRLSAQSDLAATA